MLCVSVTRVQRFNICKMSSASGRCIPSLISQLILTFFQRTTSYYQVACTIIVTSCLKPCQKVTEPLAVLRRAPSAHLLFGATGLMGSHLLRYLIKGGATKVYCIVRAATDEAGASGSPSSPPPSSAWPATC